MPFIRKLTVIFLFAFLMQASHAMNEDDLLCAESLFSLNATASQREGFPPIKRTKRKRDHPQRKGRFLIREMTPASLNEDHIDKKRAPSPPPTIPFSNVQNGVLAEEEESICPCVDAVIAGVVSDFFSGAPMYNPFATATPNQKNTTIQTLMERELSAFSTSFSNKEAPK